MVTPYHLPKKRGTPKGTRISFLRHTSLTETIETSRDSRIFFLYHFDWLKMLNSEFSLRKFQNLNFQFMKQYSPNSNIIITTYLCIYLYIQQVYGFLLSSFLLCQFYVCFRSSFFAFYVLCLLWQKMAVMFIRVVDLVDRGRVSLFEGCSEIFYV